MLMRIANTIELVLLVLGTLASLLFLPDAAAVFGEEPEGVWLLSFTAIFCLVLGSLCGWNALSGWSRTAWNRRALLVANSIAVVFLVPVLALGAAEMVLVSWASVTFVFGGLAAMGPITQLLRLRQMAGATT